MATLSSRPNPDLLAQCFTLVRWLHASGISWSGTASELASKLSSECAASLCFANTDELVAFLEANTDMLAQLGLDVSLRKLPGRPRFIDLQLNQNVVAAKPAGPIEIVGRASEIKAQSPKVDTSISEKLAAPPTETHDGYVPLFANQPEPEREIKQFTPSEPVSRLYSLLGLPAEDALVEEPREEVVGQKSSLFADYFSDGTARQKMLPFIIAGAMLIVVALAFGVNHYRDVSTHPTPETIQPAVLEKSPQIDPVEAEKTKALLQQASTGRLAVPQYELAMRYEEGRGVAKDLAAAYAWLVIARANGSTRAPAAIRTVGANLSPADMQRARITVGKAFAAGVNVPRSYVIAHNWFSLAELGGSTEAAALKKQLEAKMSPLQLRNSNTQTASR